MQAVGGDDGAIERVVGRQGKGGAAVVREEARMGGEGGAE
jgi:hypothetical protein